MGARQLTRPRGSGAGFTRRQFLQLGLTLTGASALRCRPAATLVPVRVSYPDFGLGHQVRTATPAVVPEPAGHVYDVIIVGAGVSGLSAARQLLKEGITNIKILDLEPVAGGNARSGQGRDVAYPLGAHYLPVPNPDLYELIDFLEEIGVVEGLDSAGLPIYNDLYLCHEPEERLFINGYWQSGLVPQWGVPEADRRQLARFHDLMRAYAEAKGDDGRYAFDLPVSRSSTDVRWQPLHLQHMSDWLEGNGLDSPYLRWYVDYCCLDDYGAPASAVSAWAGIHYFAARRGRAANAQPDDVLTWPEGNAFLVGKLAGPLQAYLQLKTLVRQVLLTDDGVQLVAVHKRKTEVLHARQVVMAMPQFIARHVLAGVPAYAARVQPELVHYPWLVANLHLREPLAPQKGEPLSWDNVLFGRAGLGYVHANHQQMGLAPRQTVLTYYHPLTEGTPKEARQKAQQTTADQWRTLVLEELAHAHPHLGGIVEQIDVWVWGHGMVCPSHGLLINTDFQVLAAPIEDKIYFAHTDYSGISLFEEAFYQGVGAGQNLARGARYSRAKPNL